MDMDFSNDGKEANIEVSAQEHEDSVDVEQDVETSLSKSDNHENITTIGENKNPGSETTSAEEVNTKKYDC
jgi:hypothetical protein